MAGDGDLLRFFSSSVSVNTTGASSDFGSIVGDEGRLRSCSCSLLSDGERLLCTLASVEGDGDRLRCVFS